MCFIEKNIILMFYCEYFLLLLQLSQDLKAHRMIATTTGTFIWESTIINVMVKNLLTIFPTQFLPSSIILMVAIFLSSVTSQWIGYVLLHPLHCIANFYFSRYFWCVKAHYICIRLYCFSFFVN